MGLKLATGLVLSLSLLLPAARAGDPTFDARDYIAVGAFSAWEMIDKELWDGGAGVKDESQVISVAKVFVEDGVTRYNVRTSFFQNVKDALFQFGVDGDVVYLYGVRVINPGPDLGESDLSVPTVFFDPPVPVGDAATEFGTYSVTPITSVIDVSLKVGPKKISAKLFIDGVVTARWNPVDPVLTPLGLLGNDELLAELQLDFLFTYSSPNGDVNDEVEDKVTNKSVAAVLGPELGYVQIDGKGSQQKILNRAILPGLLVSNPAEPDAFPDVPDGDASGFGIGTIPLISLHEALLPEEGTAITDGLVSLSELSLTHELGGKLVLTGEVSYDGAGPVPIALTGKGLADKLTGGVKVALKGQTKQLKALTEDGFPKLLKLSVKQLVPASAEGGVALSVIYSAGKHPETKELITGTLLVPVDPFVVNEVSVDFNVPVDVPKLKAGLLVINPAKRTLGAEGQLVLHGSSAEGGPGTRSFPVLVVEKLSVKEGLPVPRAYVLRQTGLPAVLFNFKAASSEDDYTLFKFGGKLMGAKLVVPLEEVELEFPR